MYIQHDGRCVADASRRSGNNQRVSSGWCALILEVACAGASSQHGRRGGYAKEQQPNAALPIAAERESNAAENQACQGEPQGGSG